MTQWLGMLWSRLSAAFRKTDLDREFNDEIAAHAELLTEENRRRGMSPGAARRAALIALGGIESAKELHRDTRGLPSLDSVLQDLRYTFRTLRRDAGFTTFAVLIVGLGIGASSTIFSVVNTLLLRPLPFRDPGRLVWIANQRKGRPFRRDHAGGQFPRPARAEQILLRSRRLLRLLRCWRQQTDGRWRAGAS